MHRLHTGGVGNYIQYDKDAEEPMYMMLRELRKYIHLIIQRHYKMLYHRKSAAGLVFGTLEILIILIEAASMSFLRKSVIAAKDKVKWLALGAAGYTTVALVFREVLKFASMARANALWDAGSIVLVTFVGKFVYGEQYTPRQWLGVGFAIAAVLCMIGPELEPKRV